MKDGPASGAVTDLVARLEAAGIDEHLLVDARAAAARLCAGVRVPAPAPLEAPGHADFQALLAQLAPRQRS